MFYYFQGVSAVHWTTLELLALQSRRQQVRIQTDVFIGMTLAQCWPNAWSIGPTLGQCHMFAVWICSHKERSLTQWASIRSTSYVFWLAYLAVPISASSTGHSISLPPSAKVSEVINHSSVSEHGTRTNTRVRPNAGSKVKGHAQV